MMSEEDRQHIDDLLARIQRSLVQRWSIVIVVILVIAAFTFKGQVNNSDTASKARTLALANQDLSRENHRLSIEIQRERFNATFNSCWDSAQRHDRTIALIRKDVHMSMEKLPSQKRALKEQLQQTIFIIDDLAPAFRHCGKHALQVITGHS
jgi:hypothetical protein